MIGFDRLMIVYDWFKNGKKEKETHKYASTYHDELIRQPSFDRSTTGNWQALLMCFTRVKLIESS